MTRREFFLSTAVASAAYKNLKAQSRQLNADDIRRAALTIPPIYERIGIWYAEIRREINWETRPIKVRQFYLKLMEHSEGEGKYEEKNVLTRLNEAKLTQSPLLSPFITASFKAVIDHSRGKFFNIATLAFDSLVRVEADLYYSIDRTPFIPIGVEQQGILLEQDLEIMHNPERRDGTILSF